MPPPPMTTAERKQAAIKDGIDNIDRRAGLVTIISDIQDELAIIGHCGNKGFGGQPGAAVERMRDLDQGLHTDIGEELRRIEESLTRQKLEALYEQQDHSDLVGEEADEARENWIQARMEGRSKVKITLPTTRGESGRIHGSTVECGSKIAEMRQNPEFDAKKQRDEAKAKLQRALHVGDEVRVDGEQRAIVSALHKNVQDGIIVMTYDIVMPDFDNEMRANMKREELELLQKTHPADAISGSPQSRGRQAYSGKSKASSQAQSQLASVFSREGSGEAIEFLRGPSEQRLALDKKKSEELSKRPKGLSGGWNAGSAGKASLVDSTGGARIGNQEQLFQRKPSNQYAGVASRAKDVHLQQDPIDCTMTKQMKEQVPLTICPETLRILDIDPNLPKSGPGNTLRAMKGKRVTHICPNGNGPSQDGAVHTGADMRRQMGRALNCTTVFIRAEPTSRRAEVEKKKMEYTDKVPAKKPTGK